MRNRPFMSGALAWIRNRPPFAVAGLLHGEPVTVVSTGRGFVFVRDSKGRDRGLAQVNVDSGRELRGKSGHWYPESHPRRGGSASTLGQAHLAVLEGELVANRDPFVSNELRARILDIKDVLARVGDSAKV